MIIYISPLYTPVTVSEIWVSTPVIGSYGKQQPLKISGARHLILGKSTSEQQADG